jgi:zinc D-Ala-D-Ala carboxypeptidase
MKLTENFSLHEMTQSAIAAKRGLSNNPTPEHLENLKLLCEKVLEPVRELMKCPIKITSGYRSGQLNSYIGGSASSQHMFGQAVDIDLGEKNAELYNAILSNLEFDQMIWEFGSDKNPDWVHISYSETKNRKQCLKAVKQNGKTVYLDVTPKEAKAKEEKTKAAKPKKNEKDS